MLILRDAVTSKTHNVPPTGAVIGREGGDADIVVQDAKVSKRHARIYAADGGWWLEDLQSANGTYIEKHRIAVPVEVAAGTGFRLAAHDFHVVEIGGESRTRSRAEGRPGAQTLHEMPAFPETETDGAARQIPAMPTLDVGEEDEEHSGHSGAEDPDEMSPDATPQQQIGKAIAFHLATVPLLAFNPVGTVRKSIEKQRFPPLEKLPLLGLAAPGLGILLAVGVVFQAIGALISLISGGGFSAVTGLIIGVVVAIVGAAIGGLIIAFAYHPVFKFIIERLFKGESTMKSRTNFLVISQSVGILSAVPNGLAALSALLAALIAPHIPRLAALIPIVPSIIQLACTLISVLLAYRWFVYFKVHKVVPILILIGGALAVLGTGLGVLNGLRVAIVGGPTAAVVTIPGAEPANPTVPALPALPGATPGHPATAAAVPPGTPATAAEAAKAAAVTATAAAAAAATVGKPEKAAAEPDEKPEPATKSAEKADGEKLALAAKAKLPEPKPEAAAEPEPSAPAPVKLNAYQRYAQKRDAVEHAITDDPLVLKRDANVSKGYRAFRAAVGKARKSESSKSGGDEVLLRHLIDADVFGTQARTIDELYTRLHLSAPPVP